MKKNTKRVFYLGIIFILLSSGYKPLLLLTFGYETTGIIEHLPVSPHGNYQWQSYNPLVTFTLENNQQFTFEGGIDMENKLRGGEKVIVLYLPAYPKLAEIKSSRNLFEGFFIKISFCLLVWIAFLTSFTDIFDKNE